MSQMHPEMSELPTNEYVFVGHDAQNEPPNSSKYVPASHNLQEPDPLEGLYDPAVHAEHPPPLFPSNPTAQMQRSIAALPDREIVFGGQAKHCEPPVVFSHVPASHSTHTCEPFTAL